MYHTVDNHYSSSISASLPMQVVVIFLLTIMLKCKNKLLPNISLKIASQLFLRGIHQELETQILSVME